MKPISYISADLEDAKCRTTVFELRYHEQSRAVVWLTDGKPHRSSVTIDLVGRTPAINRLARIRARHSIPVRIP